MVRIEIETVPMAKIEIETVPMGRIEIENAPMGIETEIEVEIVPMARIELENVPMVKTETGTALLAKDGVEETGNIMEVTDKMIDIVTAGEVIESTKTVVIMEAVE